MRLSTRQSGDAADVLVLLTEPEAQEIVQAIGSRLDGETGYRGPGYHLHLESDEGSELTIGILDPEQGSPE
jgi:hypothetical protein